MVRVANLESSLQFFTGGLGLVETSRKESVSGRFTLVFLATAKDIAAGEDRRPVPQIELTYNWDPEVYSGGRNFGHLAFAVEDIYVTCHRLEAQGIQILRPPRDGKMAFVRSPDSISIELLQEGPALVPSEPWLSRGNAGTW
jgi:lactoylglutathione lyase